ncbi:obscurin-like [Sitophilus oryzae]|uniref:Obscurin-like n=1 Tax=Sitophilus oryzae TaxID=7048 RepID=A0A6J2XXL0_SITOR|nr:obscurin-like [Sitophilus oryzae]
MSGEQLIPENLLKDAIKPKDGDQLFSQDEGFTALMGDDEDTVAFVFQHVNPEEDGTLTSVAKTTRGILSFGAVVQGEVEHEVSTTEKSPGVKRKPFRHWKPSLIVEKTEVICFEGDQAMLQVQVKGYPKPDMRCIFKDIPIKPSSKYKIYHENEEHILLLVIKDTNLEDVGIYTIMAENEIGFASVDIKLTVIRQRYPEIKTKVDDFSVCVGQVLIIPIEVDGLPKPEVKFLKEGREIVQSDNVKILDSYPLFTLVINKTTLQDSGIYSVAAINNLSEVTEYWGLYVYTKPNFIQKLGPHLIVSQNETVTLKTKFLSEPRATVRWLKDDQEIFSSQRLIIDDDEGFYFLKIKDIVIQDAAVYKFTAENTYGFIEDSVRIDVKKAPTILEAFEDAEVLEQDVYHIIHTVEFGIKLEVFPKPSVKWFLDGIELLYDRQEFTRIETLDTVKLIVNEPTTHLSGEYRCIISNECGEAEAKAKLTVNCSPRILVHLNDQTVEEHSSIYFEIVSRCFPAPRFKWFRNGQELDTDDRIQMGLEMHGKKQYKIICSVSEISYAERGEYEVEVINSFGSIRSRCAVNVLTKPVILEAQMNDMVIREDSDITYTVRAFSNPPPEVFWTWEGELVNMDDLKDKNKLITSNNGMDFRMGIRKAKMVDAGTYQCVVRNSVGQTKHRAALAIVRKKHDESDDS